MRFYGNISSLRNSSGMSRLGYSTRRSSSSKSSVRLSNSKSISSLFSKKNISNPLANISTNTYDKIGTGAKNVSVHANKLLNTGKGNIFEGKEKPDKAITDEIKAFVADYNSLMTTMQTSGSQTYKGYAQDIKNQVSIKKADLSEVGITYKSDGTLEIDSKKLETVDINKLKGLFNSKDSLTAKIADKSLYIEKRVALDKIISTYDSGQLNGYNYKA